MDLRHQCQRLFPNDMYHRVGNAVYAEQLSGGSNQNATQQTKIGASDNGRILSEKDYRFFLLRHTSLFESMVHSNYIATKLQVWTNRGMHKLLELLAKMGFPLDECRQPYAFMKPTLKRRLGEQIANYAEVSTI
jgi:cell division control protein 45